MVDGRAIRAKPLVRRRYPSTLERYAQLSRGLRGYVSTQFGAGYEYIPDNTLEISRGSQRVENLLFRAPRAVSNGFTLLGVGSNWTLRNVRLTNGFPLRLHNTQASVRLINVSAKTGQWVRDIQWAELYGCRTSEFWSVEMASRRALQELLAAAVDVREMERQSLDIADFLATYRQRHVLLLGDFGAGADRLTALETELRTLGYLPIRADRIPDIREYDLRQKIQLLMLSCRFVVIEDSTAAGQLSEIPLVEASRIVTLVLRSHGRSSSWMTAGLSQSSNVMREYEYDTDSLTAVMRDGTKWAETQLEDRGRKFDEMFPWRKPS